MKRAAVLLTSGLLAFCLVVLGFVLAGEALRFYSALDKQVTYLVRWII